MDFPYSILSENCMVYKKENFEMSPQQVKLEDRLRKTLYFGKLPSTERSSFPLTDLTVELFQDATSRQLGRIDVPYASSVSRKACISPCAMMIGMIYMRRLKNKNPDYLDNVTSSDLFLMCMMMASKFHYDEGVDEEVFNDEWAESANMDVEDVNQLEREFLSAIDWNLFVNGDDFNAMLRKIEQRIALSQGIDRGWFSYTDLDVLCGRRLSSETVAILMDQVCKVIAACLAAYVAGVVTMVISTAVVTSLPVHLTMLSSTLPSSIHTVNQSKSLLPDQPSADAMDSHDHVQGYDYGLSLVLPVSEPANQRSAISQLTIVKNVLLHFVYGLTSTYGATNLSTRGCSKKHECSRQECSATVSASSDDFRNRNFSVQGRSYDQLDSYRACSNCVLSNHNRANNDLAGSPISCSWELQLERNEKPFFDIAIGFRTSPLLLYAG